jgi:hypothetical protein
MSLYDKTKYDVNSSSFVGYIDYTSSSLTTYVLPVLHANIVFQKNPNITTLKAMEEAKKKNQLKNYSSVEEFFEDLKRQAC